MKGLNTVAAAMFAAALLTGCSEDQTTFNVEDVPGRCTIEGKIVYNQGTTFENGQFVYDYKAAANMPVIVIVDNSDYDSKLSGVTTFNTTTDESGAYSIEIPAPLKSISATIRTADFQSTRSVVTIENNKVVTKSEDVVYRANETVSDVHSQGIVLANIVCTECNAADYANGFNEYATLKGTIGKNSEYYVAATPRFDYNDEIIGYDPARVIKCWVPAPKVDMVVTVNYGGGVEFTYNTTTDANGDYTLKVPVNAFPANFDYSISAVTFDSKYTHYERYDHEYTNAYGYTDTYTDYRARSLDGFFTQQFQANYSANLPVAAQVESQKSKIMVFNPLNDGQDTYNYSASEFSPSNLWLSEILNVNE